MGNIKCNLPSVRQEHDDIGYRPCTRLIPHRIVSQEYLQSLFDLIILILWNKTDIITDKIQSHTDRRPRTAILDELMENMDR
jgi:hypothetical protein